MPMGSSKVFSEEVMLVLNSKAQGGSTWSEEGGAGMALSEGEMYMT